MSNQKTPARSRPGLPTRTPTARTRDSGLGAEKKSLIGIAGSSPVVSHIKRSAPPSPSPSASEVSQAKIAKIAQSSTVVRKIAPYDYKARFNDLLEKHKDLKNSYNEKSHEYENVCNDIEILKETLQKCMTERNMLDEKLNQMERDYEIMAISYNKIIEKTDSINVQSLEDVTKNLIIKSASLEVLAKENMNLTKQYFSIKEEVNSLRQLADHHKSLSKEHKDLQEEFRKAQENICIYSEEICKLHNILAEMNSEQRILRNTIQDLKGNIRVYCRLRPALASEAGRKLFKFNVLDACSIEITKNDLMQSKRETTVYTFDGIFPPNSSQEDVFAVVSPMVQSALDGYNVCIFAYGQTGSGKTYTMEGGCDVENYGIIPRCIEMILNNMEDLGSSGWEFTITASFLEIQNEVIYDLLNKNKDQPNHEIRMVNSKSTDLFVTNLEEKEIKSFDEFLDYFRKSKRNHQSVATSNNEHSSRSHYVAQIKISANNKIKLEQFKTSLNLVDLAASETGKTVNNKSLSELTNVVIALQNNQPHVPYRNSKLTHLLMPSLGGNSKTLMFVNVNLFEESFNDTLYSLKFATKVRSCRVKSVRNSTYCSDS